MRRLLLLTRPGPRSPIPNLRLLVGLAVLTWLPCFPISLNGATHTGPSVLDSSKTKAAPRPPPVPPPRLLVKFKASFAHELGAHLSLPTLELPRPSRRIRVMLD